MPDWKHHPGESMILVWHENPDDPGYVVMLPFDGASGWLCIKVDDEGSHQIGNFWLSMFGAMDAAARDAGIKSVPRQTWDIPDGWEMVSTHHGPTMQKTDVVRDSNNPWSGVTPGHGIAITRATHDEHLGAREKS